MKFSILLALGAEIMKVQKKIRELRKENDWTQEEMGKRMNLSRNGYAKLESGERKLSLDKLQKIADIFQVDITELLNSNQEGIVHLSSDERTNSPNYYNSHASQEIDRLQLIISHKEEIIQHQNQEIEMLKKLLAVYEKE